MLFYECNNKMYRFLHDTVTVQFSRKHATLLPVCKSEKFLNYCVNNKRFIKCPLLQQLTHRTEVRTSAKYRVIQKV